MIALEQECIANRQFATVSNVALIGLHSLDYVTPLFSCLPPPPTQLHSSTQCRRRSCQDGQPTDALLYTRALIAESGE